MPHPQALAQAASSGGKGQQAVAQVVAQAFSSGGTATAMAQAVAEAYGKNKNGVASATAQALAQANSDGGKTQAAAQAVAEVRAGHAWDSVLWLCVCVWVVGDACIVLRAVRLHFVISLKRCLHALSAGLSQPTVYMHSFC